MDLRMYSKQFISEFIELYRLNPCLWKIKSPEYSDKIKKNDAYKVLVDKLQTVEPNADREMVVKKINSIRTSFRKELKKVIASKKSGAASEDIYKPTLWYFEQMLFLQDQDIPRQSSSTFEDMDTCASDSRGESEFSNMEDPIHFEVPMAHLESAESHQLSSQFVPPLKRQKTSAQESRKQLPWPSEELHPQTTAYHRSPQPTTARTSTESSREDIFGQFVSSEMKQISDRFIYHKTQCRIQQALMDGLGEDLEKRRPRQEETFEAEEEKLFVSSFMNS